MKFNLKTFPDLVKDPTTNEQEIITWKKGFEKELREELKILNEEINEYIKTNFEAAKYARIGKFEKIEEILGEA